MTAQSHIHRHWPNQETPSLCERLRGALAPGKRRSPAAPSSAARRRFGNTTLEAVLVLTILVNITFGTIEFGYYFFVRNSLQTASRDGCRAAILGGATQAGVTTAVLNDLIAAGLLPSTATSTSPYTITTSPANITTAQAGNSVSVTVSGTWGTVGSGFRPLQLIGASKIISGASAMRAEANGSGAVN